MSGSQVQSTQEAINTQLQNLDLLLDQTAIPPDNLSALPVDGQPAPGSPPGTYHQIVPQETLWSLAQAAYGATDATHTNKISQDARNTMVIDWDSLPTGIVIVIPN